MKLKKKFIIFSNKILYNKNYNPNLFKCYHVKDYIQKMKNPKHFY